MESYLVICDKVVLSRSNYRKEVQYARRNEGMERREISAIRCKDLAQNV